MFCVSVASGCRAFVAQGMESLNGITLATLYRAKPFSGFDGVRGKAGEENCSSKAGRGRIQ